MNARDFDALFLLLDEHVTISVDAGTMHSDEALQLAERASAELRDLVRGILPAALSRGGLRAGIESFVADVPLTGGAVPSGGMGLTGLFDRVEASEGSLLVDSPLGVGITIHATLPLRPLSLSVHWNGPGAFDLTAPP